MAKVEFELTLEGGEEKFGVTHYRPGDTLSGVLTIIPDSEVTCRHFHVYLEWYTEGRGTRYRERVDELDLFQGVLRAHFASEHEFSFILPQKPWSYQGHYVSIVWQLVIQLDVPWATDPEKIVPLVLQPDRASTEA